MIPDDDGGVWIYDVQAFSLKHFDGQGRPLASLGRRGEGPGEFSGNACARPGVDGEIWVETETVWHRFAETGELVGTFPTPSRMACAVRTWLPDGRYLAADGGFDRETGEIRSHFVILRWTGESLVPVDTVEGPDLPPAETVTLVSASGQSRSTDFVPFSHAPGLRLERGGLFWVWDGAGVYDIRLESLHGDTVRQIHRTYVPVPIEPELRRRSIADFVRPGWTPETEFNESRVPRSYPPFSSVILGADASVWVERPVGDDASDWDVFDDAGHYLGVIDIPPSLEGVSIRHVAADHVWGVLRDDLDVQYVIRADIIKPRQ